MLSPKICLILCPQKIVLYAYLGIEGANVAEP